MMPTDRHRYILKQLSDQNTVRIEDLAEQLGVSGMTIHRDLKRLDQAGQLKKVRGGAILPDETTRSDEDCVTCLGTSTGRIRVLIEFNDGTRRRACCPHCGLLAYARSSEQVRTFLATDYLFDRTFNGKRGSYLISPSITLCCTPTVLVFESKKDAIRFQRGFGGQVMDFGPAAHYVQDDLRI
ncbi:MAG: DeoR family transcriptional regulator [Chloroflexota bacterium]|nr:DeoR family transcriptional regulator [Chloroflexota bacterium]